MFSPLPDPHYEKLYFFFYWCVRPTLLINFWPVCWHSSFISHNPLNNFILTFCRVFSPPPACQGQLVDCIKHWTTVGIFCICDGFCAIGPVRKLLKKSKSAKSHILQLSKWGHNGWVSRKKHVTINEVSIHRGVGDKVPILFRVNF